MNRLRAWREKKGLSQSQMAQKLGLGGPRTYQRYESGERPTPALVTQAICALTNNEVGALDMHEVRLRWLEVHGVLPEMQIGFDPAKEVV